jgi:hypothetical protein
MAEENNIVEVNGETIDWKLKTLLIGAAVGVITGLLGAYIVIQTGEKSETPPEITAGDGVKVGLGLMAVLRMLADLGKR